MKKQNEQTHQTATTRYQIARVCKNGDTLLCTSTIHELHQALPQKSVTSAESLNLRKKFVKKNNNWSL